MSVTWPNITAVKFTGRGEKGDFAYECLLSENSKKLYVYNESIQGAKKKVNGRQDASVRYLNPYGDHKDHPRSFGIPTFCEETGAFKSMDDGKVRDALFSASHKLRQIVIDGHYEEIEFHVADDGLFATREDAGVGADVRRFITRNFPMFCYQMDGSWDMGW